MWSLLFAAVVAPVYGSDLLTPDPRGAAVPDRNFDVVALDLELLIDPAEGALEGKATLVVERLFDGPLVLDQVALDIKSVKVGTQTGQVGSRWWIDHDHLMVDFPGDAASVVIVYSAQPRNGMHFRTKGAIDAYSEVWTQGENMDHRYWFPSWDHPNDRFEYSGRVKLAKSAATADWKVMTNSGHNMVNYLVMVAAGPYDEYVHPNNSSVKVWVPPGTNKQALARVLDPIESMGIHFANRSGVKYPWGGYHQVFVQRFMFTGMENTAATINHMRLLYDDTVADTRWGAERTVAHELAHQWYGDLLTCRSFRELWLNEGFASFMTADYFRSSEGIEDYAGSIQWWFDHSTGTQHLAKRFHRGPDASENHNVYAKGASVLHMLRVMLGEERFWEAIRLYTRTHQHGLVETRDLQRAMETVSGRQLDWFFQQWVELPWVPVLNVSHSYSDGELTVNVRQDTEERPAYTLPIEVEVGTADGVITLKGWLEDEDLDLSTKLSEPPLYVAFDPQGGVLAKVEQEQSPEGWVAQLKSPHPYMRMRALDALGETDETDAVAAVAADTDVHRVVRSAAVEALGAQRVVEPLVPLLKDEDDDVRLMAVQALGKATGDKAKKALSSAARTDKNPDVRGDALSALANLDPKAALSLARSNTKHTDLEWAGLRRTAIRVIGSDGSAGDLGLLLNSRAPGRLRVDGAMAAADIVSRQENEAQMDKLGARVARFAEPMLEDSDLRTRQSVIGLLGDVGDQTTISHLERYRREETVSWLADRADDAIADIRKRIRKGPEASPNELEDRVKGLEEKLEALESEMEKWSDHH